MSDILDADNGSSILGAPSFSLKHRAIRAIWNITWGVLASWTPPPLHPWRRFLLRAFGAKIGKGVRIYGSAKVWYPPNLIMGDYSAMGWQVNCYNQGQITIEEFATVSQYCHLVAGTHDYNNPNFQLYTKPILIKKNAWVAANTFVGPGVTVNEGAVLGACGVTFKDLDAWEVYAGNPAQKIKERKKFEIEKT